MKILLITAMSLLVSIMTGTLIAINEFDLQTDSTLYVTILCVAGLCFFTLLTIPMFSTQSPRKTE